MLGTPITDHICLPSLTYNTHPLSHAATINPIATTCGITSPCFQRSSEPSLGCKELHGLEIQCILRYHCMERHKTIDKTYRAVNTFHVLNIWHCIEHMPCNTNSIIYSVITFHSVKKKYRNQATLLAMNKPLRTSIAQLMTAAICRVAVFKIIQYTLHHPNVDRTVHVHFMYYL
jgi:hypothetical protein